MLPIGWLLQDFMALKNPYLLNTLSVIFCFHDILTKCLLTLSRHFLAEI